MLDQGWIREVELLLSKQKNDEGLYPAITLLGMIKSNPISE